MFIVDVILLFTCQSAALLNVTQLTWMCLLQICYCSQKIQWATWSTSAGCWWAEWCLGSFTHFICGPSVL